MQREAHAIQQRGRRQPPNAAAHDRATPAVWQHGWGAIHRESQPQRARGGLSVGSGLANISQHLLDVVTQYHMRIGSGASVSELQTLQNRLLDEAEDCGVAGEWEAALNVYTHALAVSEKLAGIVRDRPEVAVQAAIVMHLGGCLHHLGELEAAGAYYEQSIQGLQRLRTPAYERWLVEAIGRVSGVAPPDITHARVQFLKSRILDVTLGRYPPESEYAGEVHSRWSSLGAKMRASGRCGKWRGDSAEGAGPTGEHAQPMYYEEEADDANDDAVAAVDLAESDADARPRPRPPTSSRAAALTAASRAQDAGIHATYGVA